MNKWVKRKWLKALRSGEYQQGTRRLVSISQETYCCLGVLACEMVPEFIRKKNSYEMAIDGNYGTIPDDLATLWELTREEQGALTIKNDNGYSFREIADWIEENL